MVIDRIETRGAGDYIFFKGEAKSLRLDDTTEELLTAVYGFEENWPGRVIVLQSIGRRFTGKPGRAIHAKVWDVPAALH